MPITDRKQAREAGWAQVRQALQSFEGTVVSAEFGKWGGQLVDDTGKPLPPKEFLEVVNTDIKVLETSEPLVMDVEGQDFTFRVNCSDFVGSFWVEDFLASADVHKLLIPDDLDGKRILWKKATRQYNIRGREVESTNFIIAGIAGTARTPTPTVAPVTPEVMGVASSLENLIAFALEVAVGKTETQFRSAMSLDPKVKGNPLLPLIQSGSLTASLVAEGRLIESQEGNKKVYRKP